MRHNTQSFPIVPVYIPALVCGMSIGHIAIHSGDMVTTAALVLGSTLLLSMFQPGRAWLHALLVGVSIPAGLALAQVSSQQPVLGVDPTLPMLLPVLAPAGIGAAIGALLRRGGEQTA